MKKFLVLDFYDNEISVIAVKDTHKDAYACMKEDYDEFIDHTATNEDTAYIDDNSAFCNLRDGLPCWWCIKPIDIPDNGQETKHGKWIGERYNGMQLYDDWYCSECGYSSDTNYKPHLGRYCSECGAEMDKE